MVGRDAELAELASFCRRSDAGAYRWWRAGPWAGKSALLSTFVLHPPPDIQMVAFFITSRLAGQDNREAFLTVVLEQLCELTGEELPAGTPEATREAHFLDLLSRAAGIGRRAGKRLVLLVDGLDEDRGVTIGPDAHSIAGLLPAHPPAGMRIVVAGRPNPPIPDDVPQWHPLREPAIVRELAPSPYAGDVRRQGESELKRLLKGSAVDQELLGLITAARGGLSAPDLRELTGFGLAEIEDVLHAAAGRTFTRRAASQAGEAKPDVYLLGHEELQNAAEHYLGERRLAGHLRQLHDWADRYRTAWPSGTPEYLLRGYPRMLQTTGDIDGLVGLATDQRRHDRMLDLTGGDAAALDEIRNAQDGLLARSPIDLFAMACLSISRNNLLDRNANIPADLPGLWAALGQFGRAESLADGIADTQRQAKALSDVARAVACAGDADRAEAIAQTISDDHRRAQALAGVARWVAAAGDVDRAEVFAWKIDDADQRWQALAAVAETAAQAGDLQRAETIVWAITDLSWHAQALAGVARALASTGDFDRGATVASAITDAYQHQWALADVGHAAARTGDVERAEEIIGRIEEPDRQARALADVARAIAVAGDPTTAMRLASRAEAVVRGSSGAHSHGGSGTAASEPEPDERALVTVAQAAALAGDLARATAVVHGIRDKELRLRARAAVTSAAAAGRPASHPAASTGTSAGRAGAVESGRHPGRPRSGPARGAAMAAPAVTDPVRRAQHLVEAAWALVQEGDTHAAARFAADAETAARTVRDPGRQAQLLTGLAKATAIAGDLERAVTVAVALPEKARAQALAVVAETAATAGAFHRAAAIAREIGEPDRRAQALAVVAEAAGGAGEFEIAIAIAGSIGDGARQATALWNIAHMVGLTGDHRRAREIAAKAVMRPGRIRERISPEEEAIVDGIARAAAGTDELSKALAGAIDDPERRSEALSRCAVRAAGDGAVETAVLVAHAISTPAARASTLINVAQAAAGAGQIDQAEALARTLEVPYQRAQALAGVAQGAATAGDVRRGEAIARSIGVPEHDRGHRPADGPGDNRSRREALRRAQVMAEHEALSRVARSAAAVGHIDEAASIARTIGNQLQRTQALAGVARSAALAGRIEWALALVEEIGNPDQRTRALTGVACAAADAGRTEIATAVALTIPDPEQQAQTLIEIAEATGDRPVVRRLLAQAFAIGSWASPLATVARIEPGIVFRIVDGRSWDVRQAVADVDPGPPLRVGRHARGAQVPLGGDGG